MFGNLYDNNYESPRIYCIYILFTIGSLMITTSIGYFMRLEIRVQSDTGVIMRLCV